MIQILKCNTVASVIKDMASDKIYIQNGKFNEETNLVSNLNNVECVIPGNSEIIIRHIYKNYIFSYTGKDGKVFDFSKGKFTLIKKLEFQNIEFNKTKSRFYFPTYPNNTDCIEKCFSMIDFTEVFQFEHERSAMPLIYFEDKIVLRNRSGTKLFFYENDTLLFTKDIPLYYEMNPYPQGNPLSKEQTFKLITKYENQLVCYVNWDRIISVDINTGEILWQLLDKEIEGYDSTRTTFFSLFAYATAVDNIIHVLHGSYIQIDIKTRKAKVLYDLTKNNLNIAGMYAMPPTFYKNKFYFLVGIDGERMNTNNKFGVFNTDTLMLEHVETIEMPQGSSIAGTLVDDKYIYIGDTKGCLYIYGDEDVNEEEIAIFQNIIDTNKLQNKTEEKELPKPTVQELDIEEYEVLDVFGNVLSPTSYYIGLPDCITQSDDYKCYIEYALKLTNGLLVLNDFQSEEKNNKFILNLIINGVAEVFSIPYRGQYIEGESLVIQLNALIDKYDKNNAKRFLAIFGPEVDFGIAFITEAEKQALITGGHIWEV